MRTILDNGVLMGSADNYTAAYLRFNLLHLCQQYAVLVLQVADMRAVLLQAIL